MKIDPKYDQEIIWLLLHLQENYYGVGKLLINGKTTKSGQRLIKAIEKTADVDIIPIV